MTVLPPSIPIPQRIDFMRRIHLFYRLQDDHFESIAEKLVEETYKAGDVIITKGEFGDRFLMIYSGSVTVTGKNQQGGEKQIKLVAGDYFGEEALLTNRARNATVAAAEKTVLLALPRADFNQQLKKVRQLKSNFDVTTVSRKLAGSMHFKWLRDENGEVVYFLARKHPVLLVQVLLAPVMLGAVCLVGLVTGFMLAWPWLLWPSVAGLGLLIGVGIWNAVDWGNDYYIVTNQRVVWLEKVVGIYDSRQEAPLSAVQRINVQTDFWGRRLDYGTLIVRTIVGSTLNLHNVNHPYQAAALIEEHWKRAKQSSRKMEEEAMRQALRERLVRKQAPPAPPPSIVQKPAPQNKKSPYSDLQRGLGSLFRVRFDDLSTITYRKHWIVLLTKIWLPSLVLLALVGGLLYAIVSASLNAIPALIANAGVDVFLLAWFLLLITVFGWWYYRYLDWSNDIFQVTPDQILDINKKPLGNVTSDIAALDNILHLEYERKGMLQVLFNYGNVNITIGGGKDMTFEDLYNPSAVQDDIERRRLERIEKKEQTTIKAERERMADWFAAYHNNQQEMMQAMQGAPAADETDPPEGGSNNGR